MAETAFDRTERGLGSADLSIPDIVARTKGNPQDIMKLVMNGQINVTQGLLAKRLSDSVVAERNAMAAQQPNVLQEQFPEMAQATGGLGAMPQAAPPMPAQMGPQMGPQMGAPAPQGMPPAQGGIGGLDFAPTQMAGGGIVGYNVGGTTAAPQTLMGIPPELLAQINPALNLDAAGAQLQGVLPTESEAREKLKARLEAGFDPEKERKRAELAGLFAGLGAVQPGMSPMEALVSGFVGGGKQIQESKKEMEAKEMELLKTSAELEEASNRTAREVYGLQLQLAEAERRGASDAAKAEIEVRLADAKQKFEAQQNALSRANALDVANANAAARSQASREYRTSQAFTMLGNVRRQAKEAVDAVLGPTSTLANADPDRYNAMVRAEERRMINAIAGDDARLAEQLRTIQGIGAGEASGSPAPPPPGFVED